MATSDTVRGVILEWGRNRSRPRGERRSLFQMLDDHLLSQGWTIRDPIGAKEIADYGSNLVYVSPHDSQPMGWAEAVENQEDFEEADL